jgi:hypothetical protein
MSIAFVGIKERHCETRAHAARDATGAIEFMWCPVCGVRSYKDLQNHRWSEWAPDAIWRKRFAARRVVDVMLAAGKPLTDVGRDHHRREVFATVARWMNRPRVGMWHEWTEVDCDRIILRSGPLLAQLADTLVEGGDRLALHVARAKGSRFPRIVVMALLTRDRIRASWRSTLARWRGENAVRDEDAL